MYEMHKLCLCPPLRIWSQHALNFNWSSSTHLFLRPQKINNIKLSLRGKFALFCRPLETNKQTPPWEFMIYDFIITCGGSAVAYGYRHHNSTPCRTTLDLTNYFPMIPISCLSLGGLLRSKIFHQVEHNYPIQDGPHMPQNILVICQVFSDFLKWICWWTSGRGDLIDILTHISPWRRALS